MIALSLLFITAIVPVRNEPTPERLAIINKVADTGSAKKLGLSLGAIGITIFWLKTKNRTNDKMANTEAFPNLLFGINKYFISLFLLWQ